jgi:hypothetical protein
LIEGERIVKFKTVSEANDGRDASCYSIFNFLCSALWIIGFFVFLSFSFWPLYYVTFNLQLLITPLSVSSNFNFFVWSLYKQFSDIYLSYSTCNMRTPLNSSCFRAEWVRCLLFSKKWAIFHFNSSSTLKQQSTYRYSDTKLLII